MRATSSAATLSEAASVARTHLGAATSFVSRGGRADYEPHAAVAAHTYSGSHRRRALGHARVTQSGSSHAETFVPVVRAPMQKCAADIFPDHHAHRLTSRSSERRLALSSTRRVASIFLMQATRPLPPSLTSFSLGLNFQRSSLNSFFDVRTKTLSKLCYRA